MGARAAKTMKQKAGAIETPEQVLELLERLGSIPAEPWDSKCAEAWWREHGSEVKKAASAPSGSGHTIQVDLSLRRTG